MRILVIDDDHASTAPLLWRLTEEGHSVERQADIDKVLRGWFEVRERSLAGLARDGVPAEVLDPLIDMLDCPFGTAHEMRDAITTGPIGDSGTPYADQILDHTHQNVLAPPPDCIILDVVLPWGSYGPFTTTHGQDTGLVLLEELRQHAPRAQIIVTTARDERAFTSRLRHLCSDTSWHVLAKPYAPAHVLDLLEPASSDVPAAVG